MASASTKVWAAIEQCTDPATLKDVMLNASEWGVVQIKRRLMAH